MRRRRAAALVLAFAALGAARASADDLLVLDGENRIILVPADPELPSTWQTITGTELDGRVLAIAVRRRSGVLYGLTRERLYSIDLLTGRATPAGPRFDSPAEISQDFGFAFDPARGLGLLVTPLVEPGVGGAPTQTFGVAVDPDLAAFLHATRKTLAYAADDVATGLVPNVVCAAYAAEDGPTPWTLFGIDRKHETLVRLGSPGGVLVHDDDVGVATTVAPITGLDPGAQARGLEIGEDGAYFLADSTPPGGPGPYGDYVHVLDLETGVATRTRFLGHAGALDLALVPTAVLPGAAPLVVTKATLRFNYRSARKDVAQIDGVMPAPLGGFGGKTVRVDVAGDVYEFVVDVRGRGRGAADGSTFRVRTDKPGADGFPFEMRLKRSNRLRGMFSPGHPPAGVVAIDVYVDRTVRRASLSVDFRQKRALGIARLKDA